MANYIKAILQPFNIFYVDDMLGDWEYREGRTEA